jgi:protein subunit release factor B
MSLFNVSPEKEKAIKARMENAGIRESDLQESFVRSSGPGGQKVNKTSTCVLLVHVPTGIKIKAQQARSQALNRFLARRLLVERIETMQQGEKSAEKMRIEKIKRQKRRRSKKAKEKVLGMKHAQAEKKESRLKIPVRNDYE